MKKIRIFAGLLCIMLLLSSCVAKKVEAETEETKKESGEKAEESVKVDFESVIVSDYVYAYVGENANLNIEGTGFISSKPSIADVDANGIVTPKQTGVALVGYVKGAESKAIAVCVMADGEKPDRASGGSAELIEVGKSYMHSSPVGNAEYTSSNSAVCDISAAPELKFVGCGYVCINCNSVSRPFSYSFIVYDRIVE